MKTRFIVHASTVVCALALIAINLYLCSHYPKPSDHHSTSIVPTIHARQPRQPRPENITSIADNGTEQDDAQEHDSSTDETKENRPGPASSTISLANTPSEVVKEPECINAKKFYAPDRTKSIVAARFGLMETSCDIIEEMKKVDISIIVGHCDEDLSWIPEYIGENYSIKDITIYSKCGKEVKGLETLKKLSSSVEVVRLPNIGRCDHTFANWIKENYKSIRDEIEDGHDGGTNNDIVMFLKGNSRDKKTYIPIDSLLSHVSNAGFGCLQEPSCDCNLKCRTGLQTPTMQHNREYLFNNFTIGKYERLERDENDAFLSEKYTFLGEWKEDMGMVIPESETMPVCYGGLFAAQKKQILNQPEETWEKMVSSLSRADNIVEGHFAERLWASILSDIDIESAKVVDRAILPHVKYMVRMHGPKDKARVICGMAGMLYHSYDAIIRLPSSTTSSSDE